MMSAESTAIYALGQQLSIQRFMDDLSSLRAANVATANENALQNRLNEMVTRYNRLLDEANAFGDKARKLVAEQDERIIALRAAKKELAAENERLRLRLIDVEGDLALARELDKELHPEANR